MKTKRRVRAKKKEDAHCLQCEVFIPTMPERAPRFCSVVCASEHAIENTESWRYCHEKHGWWDAGWYGFPDSSYGCWECHVDMNE